MYKTIKVITRKEGEKGEEGRGEKKRRKEWGKRSWVDIKNKQAEVRPS